MAGTKNSQGDPLAKLASILESVQAYGGCVFLDIRDVPATTVRHAMDLVADYDDSTIRLLLRTEEQQTLRWSLPPLFTP